MNLVPHDFTKPPQLPPGIRSRLRPWLNRAHSLFAELMLPLGISVESRWLDCNTGWPLDTLENWIGKPLSFRVFINEAPSIIALPNRLAQALAGAMLGEKVSSEADERLLSSTESRLCDLVIATFLNGLREAWIDEAAVLLEMRGMEPNLRRSKIFRPNDPLVLCRSSLKVGESEHLWTWLIRLDSLNGLFDEEAVATTQVPSESVKRQMESLVRSMTVPLVVKLGSVRLSTPQLSELQVGDLVVLDQSTSEPLKASVSGEAAFVGWPGCVGNKQAFQVEAELKKRRA